MLRLTVCQQSALHCVVCFICQMSIIFSEDGLRDIQPPCIVQAFVNHNARLFKIFIIGRRRFIIQRPSIKNLSAGGSYIIPKFPLFLFFLLHLMS